MNREFTYWIAASSLETIDRLRYLNLLKIHIPRLNHRFHTVSDTKILQLLIRHVDLGYVYTSSCMGGYFNIVRYLVGLSPLFLPLNGLARAAENHQVQIVKFLLDVTPTEMLNVSELVRSVVNWPSSRVFKLLMTRIPNLEDLFHQLPTDDIYDLFAHDHPPFIRFIIRHGVDPNQGLAPAAAYGRYDVLKYLIEKGADVNFNQGIALKEAALGKHTRIIEWLLPQTSSEYLDDALIQAVSLYGGMKVFSEDRMANAVQLILARNPSLVAIELALSMARQLGVPQVERLLLDAELWA